MLEAGGWRGPEDVSLEPFGGNSDGDFGAILEILLRNGETVYNVGEQCHVRSAMGVAGLSPMCPSFEWVGNPDEVACRKHFREPGRTK